MLLYYLMMFLMLMILLSFTDKAVCQNREDFKMQVDTFGEVWKDFVETSLGATFLQVICLMLDTVLNIVLNF